MRIAFFDSHAFEKEFFLKANQAFNFDIHFIETRLSEITAPLAQGHDVVCSFVNDKLNPKTLETLSEFNIKLIALRSAGFNHVDLKTCKKLKIRVVRVPEYSPYSVAEHTTALLLNLNRKVHKAYNRVREQNFSLDGLVGFDLHLKKVGIIGLGKIGQVFASIMKGFGCELLFHDAVPNQEFAKRMNAKFVALDALLSLSDIVSLHCPLTPDTLHLLNDDRIAMMKPGALLLNTGRGGLVDARALIKSLKSGHLGGAALDVYEEEDGVFFQDLSSTILKDDVLARLLTFPNVIITSHQAFLTREALQNIAHTTLNNISCFQKGEPLLNEVKGL